MPIESETSTFTAPPYDGSYDILQIIEHHRQHSSNHPLFRYANANGAIQTITWGSASKSFDVATRYVLDNVSLDRSEIVSSYPVVGILANLDSITYYTLVIGIMKSGFTVFPISTRNSADAVAHLMAKTNCKALFVSDDDIIDRLVKASCSAFEASNDGVHVTTVVTPPFEYFYETAGEKSARSTRPILSRVITDPATTPCVIIHSSGTVSFPKPITLTYDMFFQHGNLVRLDGDLGKIISAHSMPMYHLMGFKVIIYSALLGVTLAVFRPSKPSLIPTPEAVLNAAVATASARIFCAPSFLESWVKQKSSVEALKTFKAIMFGGGPLQPSIGNELAGEGVTIVPMLGLTEVGTITSMFPKHTHSDGWDWFALHTHYDFKFVPEEGLKNVYRIIVKKNEFKTPVVNATVDGVPAYDTGDLFIRHPTNPQLWKVYGRAGDIKSKLFLPYFQEKTNPGPIEAGLKSSPYISDALMFGRARFRTGVLIVPSPEHVFDIINHEKTIEYTSLIWKSVQEVNQRSPQHSRIFEEMILIAHPDKPFQYTSKGSIRRQTTLAQYEQEIEELYTLSENEELNSIPTSNDVHSKVPEPDLFFPLIRTAVHTILGANVGDDDDLFRAGADSLCALSIRNAITTGLRNSKALSKHAIAALPSDLLYYLPTISKISIFLYGAAYIDRSINVGNSEGVIAPRMEGAKNGEVKINRPRVLSDEEWQVLMEVTETIVEIVPAEEDEVPLIILHGSPGTVGAFRSMLKSPGPIWAVQMSDDAPTDTAEELVAFYHRKIKAKRPNGPYRLGAYSGSCGLLLLLITTFEAAGDEITQFVMLDHFPTLFIARIDLDTVNLENPKWWTAVLRRSFEGILFLFQNTKGVMAAQSKVRIQEMREAIEGAQGSPGTMRIISRTTRLIKATLGFLLGERFAVEIEKGPNKGRKRFSPALFREFTAKIKTPLTMYLATDGIRAMIPTDKVEDFGAREYFPDAIFREVEGGHIDFLGNEMLLKSLHEDY
ncbi:acetyl-CoA synthetase-like protein [Pholiota conissans]|uniref:Acetyl-CoA synthetase-like protein n=1 Tax=Pholiota conissans TaxID=109636 RepID=A0A9P6CUS4_9AGAR|nr:acetyl-CoA synthetase-like protein [Pholiota conissans]